MRRALPWLVAAALLLTVIAASLILSGLTPIAQRTVLAEQNGSRVVQTRCVPIVRWFDLSWRMQYSITVEKPSGPATTLFNTDVGSVYDQIQITQVAELRLIPGMPTHQLAIRDPAGQPRATVRFAF